MFFSSLGVVVNMVLSTIKRSGEVIQLRTTSPEPIISNVEGNLQNRFI